MESIKLLKEAERARELTELKLAASMTECEEAKEKMRAEMDGAISNEVQLQDARERAEAAEARAVELQRSLDYSDRKVESLSGKISEMEKEVLLAHSQVESGRRVIEDLQRENAELAGDAESLDAMRSEMRRVLEENGRLREAEGGDLRRENEDLRARLKRAEDKIVRVRVRKQREVAANPSAAEVQRLQAQLDQTIRENVTLANALKEMRAKLRSVTRAAKDLDAKVMAAQAEKEQAREGYAVLEKRERGPAYPPQARGQEAAF